MFYFVKRAMDNVHTFLVFPFRWDFYFDEKMATVSDLADFAHFAESHELRFGEGYIAGFTSRWEESASKPTLEMPSEPLV